MNHSDDRRAPAVLEHAAAPAMLVAVGLVLFPVSGSDDKYITYWSAHALATMGEIVNYNGERIEQSSSLTQVVMLAALAKVLPLSMSAIGWLVSAAFGAATVAVTQRFARTIEPRQALPAGLIAASAACLVYWSFGGLEAPIAAFLGVCVLLAGLAVLERGATPRTVGPAAVATLLFVGVRPEAVFVAAAVWLGVLLLPLVRRATAAVPPADPAAERRLAARAAVLLAATLASFAALAAFRLAYFHDVFPQPVRAKVGGPGAAIVAQGLRYVFVEPWGRWDPITCLVAVLGAAVFAWRSLRAPGYDLRRCVVALACCAQVGFVSLSGGDWMEAGRFLVPLVPAAAILGASLLAGVRSPRLRGGLLAAAVAAQLFACVDLARRTSFGAPIWAPEPAAPGAEAIGADWFDRRNRVHSHFMPLAAELTRLVGDARPPDGRPVTVLSGQMGFVPYFVARAAFGRVRFIDRAGLCTRDVTLLAEKSPLPRAPTGTVLRYLDLYRLMDESGPRPAWVPPDVMFDYELPEGRDPNREAGAVAHGYATAFRSRGFPSNGSGLLPGVTEWRDAFVVVRPEIFPGGVRLEEFGFGR